MNSNISESHTVKARVVVSAKEGIVEIEGSEAFVTDQLARLKAVISQVVASGSKAQFMNGGGTTARQAATPQALEQYTSLYAHADGKIKLLKELPGTNMANKT